MSPRVGLGGQEQKCDQRRAYGSMKKNPNHPEVGMIKGIRPSWINFESAVLNPFEIRVGPVVFALFSRETCSADGDRFK
jgi:hypothetical protein